MHVITNVCLLMLLLLHLEEQMILQHLKDTTQSNDSKIASKEICGDNSYVFSETLLTHFPMLRKIIHQKMHSFLFESDDNPHRTKIWNYDRKMKNSMSTTSDASKNVGKVFMCIK